MSGPVFESMTRVETSHFVARVWRDEESLDQALRPNNGDIEETTRSRCSNMAELVSSLLELPRVSAVEVLDEAKNGVVIYRDWP